MGLRTRANVRLPFASQRLPIDSARRGTGKRGADCWGWVLPAPAVNPTTEDRLSRHLHPVGGQRRPRHSAGFCQFLVLSFSSSLGVRGSNRFRHFIRMPGNLVPTSNLHSFNRTWPLTRRQEDTPPGTTYPSQGWSPAEPALHGPQALVRFSMFSGHGPSPRCLLLR